MAFVIGYDQGIESGAKRRRWEYGEKTDFTAETQRTQRRPRLYDGRKRIGCGQPTLHRMN
jgi:hypothetical protein